ncbi:MAG: polysaccharide deacetylase family protein [Burkholderiales bacterium]
MHRRYSTPPLTHVAPDDGRIWLTFDDGPDAEWTPRILDVLAEKSMRATFFVIGRAARAHADVVRRVENAGHEIGNHTWSHRHPWTMRSRTAQMEVRDGAAAISDIVGRAPKFFRPPHGRLRQCMIDEAEAGGQRVALWSLSAVDWGPLARTGGIAARLGRTNAGDIVLMHDGARSINHPEELIRVLPDFLDTLVQRRLRPAPLATL